MFLFPGVVEVLDMGVMRLRSCGDGYRPASSIPFSGVKEHSLEGELKDNAVVIGNNS